MLNLFKKKDQELKVVDKVTISGAARLQALLAEWNRDKNTVFIFWFDDSLREATSFFATQTIEPVTLLSLREAGHPQIDGNTIVFTEHYPLRSKEEELYKKLNVKVPVVFSSLGDPLFKQFGADKIVEMMKQLGMKEEEVIEHKMISKSIRRAQEKIEDKVLIDQPAHSQQEWLEKNLGS
ncbi:MAG: hypothetical protein SGI83_18695 [Bacteroidota bacterium]|nr:hypothetical protein [Bacteroidota bacterium]